MAAQHIGQFASKDITFFAEAGDRLTTLQQTLVNNSALARIRLESRIRPHGGDVAQRRCRHCGAATSRESRGCGLRGPVYN